MKALGFVEVSGVVAAVDCMDIMCKSANVSFVTWERKLGGRLVTIIVEGSVSDVTEAVKCAQRQCVSKVVASNVIAAPHSETVRLVELSASRIARLQQAKEQKQKEAQSLDEQKEVQNQGQEPLAEQKETQNQGQEPLAEQKKPQTMGQEPLAEQKEAQNQGQEPLDKQKEEQVQTPAVSEAPKADSGARPKSTRSRTRKAKEKQDSDESGTK